MKRKVLSLVLAAAMVVSMAACGSTPAAPETTPATEAATEEAATETAGASETEVAEGTTAEEGTPVEGGSLIYGAVTELSGDWGREMWTNNAADKLVRELIDDYRTVVANQGGEFVINPTVVKNMDSVINEDGTKTFTVTINEGLVYNNGEAITAKDYVVDTLFRCSAAAQEMGATYATAWQTVVGGREYRDGEADTVTGLRLVDDYTFSIQIVADYIPYYYDLTYADAYPMNLGFWFGEGVDVADDGNGCYFTADINTDEVKANVEAARFATGDMVTAGPYSLVEFDKSALQATLVRNPNYAGNFEGQKPYIDKLVITKAEDETWNDALKTGAMEFYDSVTDGDDINAALDLVDSGEFDYVQFDRAGYGKLQFQCDFGPTQFTAVRHAVAYLLDRNEFANTFCMGWGTTVDGPYSSGLWQYQEAEEWLADNLESYAYSYDKAIETLVADGWVYDAEGNDYVEGNGLRYKKVTAEEAGTYEGNVTLADGTILMPLKINWASSEANPVSDLLSVMLAESEEVKKAGMEINKTEMTFTELLNYMYRDASQGDQYGVPTYSMYNLATGFVPAYDYSYNFSLDPEWIEQGTNVNYIFDEKLDQLSMDMVYGVEPGDKEAYMEDWKEFVKQWNAQLPEIPLYANIYVSLIPKKLHGYTQDAFWDFQDAILYAWVEE